MTKGIRVCPNKQCGMHTSDPDATVCFKCQTPLPPTSSAEVQEDATAFDVAAFVDTWKNARRRLARIQQGG